MGLTLNRASKIFPHRIRRRDSFRLICRTDSFSSLSQNFNGTPVQVAPDLDRRRVSREPIGASMGRRREREILRNRDKEGRIRFLVKIEHIAHVTCLPVACREMPQSPALFNELQDRGEVVDSMHNVPRFRIPRDDNHRHARTVAKGIYIRRKDMIIKNPIVLPRQKDHPVFPA